MLEDHVVDFICEWKVGLGFYGEQGGESIHSEFNRLHRANSILHNIRRVKSMLQQHYLKSYPKIQQLASTVNSGNFDRFWASFSNKTYTRPPHGAIFRPNNTLARIHIIK